MAKASPEPKHPEPPDNLGPAGAALWTAIMGDLAEDWELTVRELHFLERACRIEDEMRQLESAVDAEGTTTTGSQGQKVLHPGLLESRQLKLAQLRLLQTLELVDPATVRASTPASSRGRQAADKRWQRRDAIATRRAQITEERRSGNG